jgi:colanic acid/amylovoran biosynthesis glycosyltransferase
MRIAFLVPEFPSLSQTFVLNQITGLLDRGHDIEIFAAKAAQNEKYHHDIPKYELLSRTTYLPRYPGNKLERMLKGLHLVLACFSKHPKIILRSLNVFHFGKLAASLKMLFMVVPFLGRGPFDIIHCHFGPMGVIAAHCRRVGALKGKLVTTFHGYDLTSYPKKNGPKVYDILFKYSDLCLPISEHWKNRLIEMGCSKKKITVHHMGVDVRQFKDLKNIKKIKSSKIMILSVARLNEKKGIKYGIEAIAKVRKRFPDIEYLVAGDGPLRPKMERLIKQFGLESHVRLLGWMNQDEVVELMRQADILIVPSITASDGDQEGIPVVLMEALAMELPVISTIHSGIPELIIDGHNGLLAEERDSEGLAQKMIELIINKQLVKEIRKNGKIFVDENFNVNKLNEKLEHLCVQLLLN